MAWWDRYIIGLYKASFQKTLKIAESIGGVDLIMTSPPYMDARDYGANVKWGLRDYQTLGDYILRGLKPGGTCLMVIDSPIRKYRKGFGTERSLVIDKVRIDWAERVGLRVPDRMIYQRTGAVGAFSGRFRNDFEHLFWFEKLGGNPYIDKLAVAQAASHGTYGWKSNRGRDGLMCKKRKASGKSLGLANRGTVWAYTVGFNHDDPYLEAVGHPARFCTQLAIDAIKCFCPPGGSVCDPFLGSGTTMIAAIGLERNFLGGDKFSDKIGVPWVDVARGVALKKFATHPLWER